MSISGNDSNTTESTTAFNLTTEKYTTPEPKFSPCAINPCRNNGTCVEDPDDTYNCTCKSGYTGLHCQVRDECYEDCPDGACVYEDDGLRRYCVCFFGMFWDPGVYKCRASEAPCFPTPCKNGGTCKNDSDGYNCTCKNGTEGNNCQILNKCGQCTNGICKYDEKSLSKYCICNKNYNWNETKKTCDAAEAQCYPNPCKNGGACVPKSSEMVGVNCSCPAGFSGSKCQVRDYYTKWQKDPGCEKSFLKNSVRDCQCKEGYYLDAELHRCARTRDPCFPNPCKNYGLCEPTDSAEKYNCTCSEGYIGKNCEEADYCTLNGGDDFCAESECEFDSGKMLFYCSCEENEYFDYTTRTCKIEDLCPLIKCKTNEECTNNTCHCKKYYKRNNSTKECEANFCSSNPCPVDMECSNSDDELFKCSCKKGSSFNGTHCNADALCVFPSLNDCSQKCTVKNGSYSCGCFDHFELSGDNKACEYVGNHTCKNKTCPANVVCLTDKLDEMCICPFGFMENNGSCVDLCSEGVLPEGICPDDACEKISKGFRCKCEGKYKLSDDGVTCTVRKMCKVGEPGFMDCMSLNADCSEDFKTTKGYTCHCREGFTLVDGMCKEICSIESNFKACSELNAECDSYSNETLCKCPPYFHPFENGTECNKPAYLSYILTLPLSSSYYMKHDMPMNLRARAIETEEFGIDYERIKSDVSKTLKQLLPGLVYTNLLICRKRLSYLKCKIEMQFSSVIEDNMKRLTLPDMCNSGNSTNACLLSPSLLVQKNFLRTMGSVARTNPCDPDIKSHFCGSETTCSSEAGSSSFNCTCNIGFELRGKSYPFGDTESTVETCNDIDECEESPCPENMECVNNIGSYTCSCLPGYRLADDSKSHGCVKICDPSPCVQGSCRAIGDHGFECSCHKGFAGSMCNLEDKNFKRARNNTIIVGVVLGGVLFVTALLFYVCMNRLKKQKSFDSPDRTLYGTEMVERCSIETGAINNAYQRD